jgi:hypothetical protein
MVFPALQIYAYFARALFIKIVKRVAGKPINFYICGFNKNN